MKFITVFVIVYAVLLFAVIIVPKVSRYLWIVKRNREGWRHKG